jgi:type IV pilus assembly protein PilM
MAAKLPGVWGIDLGQCALKALRLENIDGTITATAFDYIEHPKILSQPDADPEQLTRDALQQFLSRNNIQGDQIAISVPGQTGLARFVKLPPVEAKKIPDIVKFEAKQQIPFPLDEVVWDWQRIGTDKSEDFTENEVGLFAMKRDMVNRYLQSFKDAVIEVHTVQMAPLALVNYVAFDVLKKGPYGSDEPGETDAEAGCIVAVDVGVDNSNLIVTDGQKVIWQRPIPIGGNHFTRALTKELKLTFAKAEHLKRNATKAEDPKKIFQAMKPVFSDFVGELQRSLGFFTNTHRGANITRMMGLGNAFRLPGLQKFVSQSLGMDLEKVEIFSRLSGDEVTGAPVFSDNILSFAVAYGLALQGLKETRIQTNLLPNEIRVDRLIRAKKPMALAGAAALLFGIGIYSWSSGFSYAHALDAKNAAKDAQSVITQRDTLQKQYDEKKAEVMKARTEAADIIRGSEERVNWPMFYRLLNDCLPRPNGSNLPDKQLWDGTIPKKIYWNNEASKAYEILLERNQQALLSDAFNQDNLIQVNVTSVYARFCDTPMANNFFTNAKNPNFNGNPNSVKTDWPYDYKGNEDWKKAPDKAGWAVEIRGYTYHKDNYYFVEKTFAENLKNRKYIAWPLQSPSPNLTKLDTSHVALVRYAKEVVRDGATTAPAYKLIDGPLWINELVKSGGSDVGGAGKGAGAGAGAAAPDLNNPFASGAGGSGAAAVTRDPWAGLGYSVPGGGVAMETGGGSGGMSKGGRSQSLNVSSSGSGGTATPPNFSQPGAGASAPAVAAEPSVQPGPKDRVRTEFVIVLYWVEPLPTEPENAKGGGAAAPTAAPVTPQ